MKTYLLAVCALLSIPEFATAQAELTLALRTGSFAPVLDLVEFASPQTPNVELQPGTVVGAELALNRIRGPFGLYAGFHYAFTRLEHTSALETRTPTQPASDVDLLLLTGGLTLEPALWDHLRPRFLAGAGFKRYDFDLVETDELGWFTVEYGVGVTVAPMGSWEESAVLLTAEFRQYVNTFDPATLPLAQRSIGNQRQFDNLFLFGLRFRLGSKR